MKAPLKQWEIQSNAIHTNLNELLGKQIVCLYQKVANMFTITKRSIKVKVHLPSFLIKRAVTVKMCSFGIPSHELRVLSKTVHTYLAAFILSPPVKLSSSSQDKLPSIERLFVSMWLLIKSFNTIEA